MNKNGNNQLKLTVWGNNPICQVITAIIFFFFFFNETMQCKHSLSLLADMCHFFTLDNILIESDSIEGFCFPKIFKLSLKITFCDSF